MVDFPPLAPSVGWFVSFLKASSQGIGKENAIKIANSGLPSSKDFGRYIIQNRKEERLVLSLAVEGGGKQLRSWERLRNLTLSEHGDWRKVHAGAWEAVLGRKPYFRYLEPSLKTTYEDLKIISLEKFNNAIFESLLSFLLGNMKLTMLPLFLKKEDWRDRGKEIADSINPELSIIQALSDHGRETILGIMAYDYK